MKRKTDKSREEAIEYKKTYYEWMAWTSVLIVQLRSWPSLLQTDLHLIGECHTRDWKNPELQKMSVKIVNDGLSFIFPLDIFILFYFFFFFIFYI